MPAVQPPALQRTTSDTALAANRMANAPTFKSTSSRGGIPMVPIVIGVVMILAITAFALTRGRPSPVAAALPPAELQVTTIGRPPEPAMAAPEPAPRAVTRDLPEDPPPPPRERRKPQEREVAPRPGHPAAAPAKEVARAEKPAATARPAGAPRGEPKSEPRPEAKADLVAEPELVPPPPQFVAATPAPPTASAPLAIGPSYAREGYQRARPASPSCVREAIRLPRDIADIQGTTATVKFAVDETGKVSQFSYLSGPTDQRVSVAIWNAVQGCEWVPGTSAQGRPLTLWVTMPFKFDK